MSKEVGRDYAQAYARAAVEDAMAAKNMTPQNLADEAGVFVGTVRDFLNGSSWPRARSLWKLEDALGWQRGRINQMVRNYEVITEEAQELPPLLSEINRELEKLDENDQMRTLVFVRDLLEKRDNRNAG